MHVLDILQNRNIDINKEAKNLFVLLCEKCEIGYFGYRSIYDFLDYVFRDLPLRGNYISLIDFISEKDFNYCSSIDDFCLLSEKVLSLLFQGERQLFNVAGPNTQKYDHKVKQIIKTISCDLEYFGYTKMVQDNDKYGSLFFVYPMDSISLIAIETHPQLAECIIDYSRPANQGNLVEKEKSLHFIIKEVEHIVQDKDFKYKKIAEQARVIFNTFHIRHDNIKGKKKNNILLTIDDKELENIYDMGYRLSLELLVLDEFQDIDQKVDDLRIKLKENTI